MFKFYLTLVFSIILLYLIYNKYFNNNYRIGEWLEINRDINIKYQLEWDISNNSSVKIANFSTWKKYFFGNDFYNTIKNNEAIVMDFFPTQDSNCILDVCDQEMKPIYHIIDPDFLIFSNQNNKNHYNLEPKKKYIFFLRDNHLGNQSKTILRKYKDITKITKKPNNKNILTCCIDEEELHKEFVTKLLESKGVLTVHGSGFGEQYGNGHFRLVYLPSIEILNSAMNKIEEFVSQ